MKSNNVFVSFSLVFFLVIITGCNASRNITASGKVTPKGAFKGGFNTSLNVATAPLAEIDDITIAAVEAIENRDSIYYDATVAALTRGLLAYSLDPVTTNTDFYIRYGLLNRMDVGYKFASGAHVFDVMYQFMGSTGTPDNPGENVGSLHGSIGLQYSGQNAALPKKVGLDKLSALFNYELSRKDILVPLVFSHSFGPEEQYGNISWGVVYGHTFINYGFNPSKTLVRRVGNNVERIPSFNSKQNYSSFGAFVNGKIGFKYVYFLPSLSLYYQNYGTYDLFGFQQENYKGLTIIPSLGLQINLGGRSSN